MEPTEPAAAARSPLAARAGIRPLVITERMRTAHTAPMSALLAQVTLIAGLAVTVGLTGAGLSAAALAVGLGCCLIMSSGLAHGLSDYGADRLGPADRVTLARATLAVGVAVLVADSFSQSAPVTLLVSLAGFALVLDAVDGWVARRTHTSAMLGARLDAEVDAFLILVLSAYVARSSGAWVLVIGAARYGFLAVGWWQAVDARGAAAALLAQARRRDAGDRANRRGRGRCVSRSDRRPMARPGLTCRVVWSATSCGCGAIGLPRKPGLPPVRIPGPQSLPLSSPDAAGCGPASPRASRASLR